jgi:proteasome alpha subunit
VTHPSGALYEYKAHAIGSGGKAVSDILEKKYSSVRSLDDCIALSLEALGTTIEGGVTRENVEMALIRSDTARFGKAPEDIIHKYIPGK